MVENSSKKGVVEHSNMGVMIMQLVAKPIGLAGLLMWLVVLISAIDKTWGILLGFGFGFWFVLKAKKEINRDAKRGN